MPTGASEVHKGAVIAGRYQLEDLLGRGGMAEVWRAKHLALNAWVAVKVLRGAHAQGDAAVRRFLAEAQITVQLKSRHAVQVFDFGVSDEGMPFLVMELLEGETLAQRLAREGRLPQRALVTFMSEAARALDRAHALGIVHRDLKPENLFLVRDPDGTHYLKVTDFGIAKIVGDLDDRPPASGTEERPSRLTRTGARVGTPYYMAPEQVEADGEVSAATDVWALGVVAFECLAGARPFDGEDAKSLFTAILGSERRSVRTFDRDLPDAFDAWFERACARRPGDRYAVATAAVDALAEALGVPDAVPRPDASSEKPTSARALSPTGAGALSESTPFAETALDLARSRASNPTVRGGSLRGRVLAAGAVVVVAGGAVVTARSFSHRDAAPSGSNAFGPVGLRNLAPDTSDLVFQPRDFRRLTFDDGCEEFPSFTKDGRSVVFDTEASDPALLVELDLATGARRTLMSVRGRVFAAAVSPDGSEVAVIDVETGAKEKGAFVLPLDAPPGAAPKFIADGSLRPSWSPDGRAIWAGDHRHYTEYAVEDRRVLRTLDAPAGYWAGESIELTDGRLVANFPYAGDAIEGAVGVYSTDGTLTRLLAGNVMEVLALMPDGKRVLAARKLESLTRVPFAVPLDGRPPAALVSAGLEPSKGLQFSRDGSRLVYSNCRPGNRLVIASKPGMPQLFPEGDWSEYDVAQIPGSTLAAVISERDGQLRPWIVDRAPGGAPPRFIETGEARASWVSASPDGALVALSTVPNGIYLAGVHDTAPARPLTTGTSDDEPVFDSRAARVLFRRLTKDGAPQIVGIPLSGGDVTPVLEVGSRDVGVSPTDGRLVYLAGLADPGLVPMLWDRRGARVPLSKELLPGQYAHPTFSPDGQRVAVFHGPGSIVEIDVASGHVLHTYGTDLSRAQYVDGEIVAIRTHMQGDIWMATVPGAPSPGGD